MNIITPLVKEHGEMRQELAGLAQKIAHPNFDRMLQDFVLKFQSHEAREEDLFDRFFEAAAKPGQTRPLKGYRNIHAGARALLKELQRVLARGHLFSVQCAFSNFHLMILSHFDYEENCVFPHIEKQMGSPESGAPETTRRIA